MILTEKQLEVLKILKRFDIRITIRLTMVDDAILCKLCREGLVDACMGCYNITEAGRKYLRRRTAQDALQSTSGVKNRVLSIPAGKRTGTVKESQHSEFSRSFQVLKSKAETAE